ncbi:MAG: glycoside hydrolase family 88 protein [Lachnospiraceae bacterium]
MSTTIFTATTAAALLADNIVSFLDYHDDDFFKSLLSVGKTEEESHKIVGWDWTHGVGLYGLYMLAKEQNNEKLMKDLTDWFYRRIEIGLPEKTVNTVCPLLTMACLYEDTKDPAFLPIIEEWVNWIMTDMTRTQERGIQHGHSELANKGHMWDDTLFMSVLFLAKVGVVFNREDYVEEAKYQFLLHAKYLCDSKTGLWYHGWTFEGRHNFAKALWGRGNCWITVFIPEFLEITGATGLVRELAVEYLHAQVDALVKFQDAESGLWHTLIDDETSYLEASCAAGFCAGILKGIKTDLLSSEYMPCAERALQGLYANLTEDGELLQVSYGTNVGYVLDDYKNIPLRKMHYGQSLALMAVLQAL